MDYKTPSEHAAITIKLLKQREENKKAGNREASGFGTERFNSRKRQALKSKRRGCRWL